MKWSTGIEYDERRCGCDDHNIWGCVSKPDKHIHFELYRESFKTIRGLDPLVANDEYFRPSLSEMIDHAQIAISFEDRQRYAPAEASLRRGDDEKRYGKQQLPQVYALRRALRRDAA